MEAIQLSLFVKGKFCTLLSLSFGTCLDAWLFCTVYFGSKNRSFEFSNVLLFIFRQQNYFSTVA
jgi:hypothetical protein